MFSYSSRSDLGNVKFMCSKQPSFFIFVALFLFSSCIYINFHGSPYSEHRSILSVQHRRLQFEGMFETGTGSTVAGANKLRRKKGLSKGASSPKRANRPHALVKAVEDILVETDRYNLWWTGPPDTDSFKPAVWGAMHSEINNAIFTMAVIQGGNDKLICSTPNDFKLFLGSARRVFSGDIVVAVEATISDDVKAILKFYNAIVYVLPYDLCSRATRSIFCGSSEERVPASVFRYYFYEKWAAQYSENSFLMFVDFRDIFFQADPFQYHRDEWFPEYQMVVFQEFYPNMVINRCVFNTRIMSECYGSESLRLLGNRPIVSSGAALGTRDAIIVWSHHMTMQLQDAPGRLVETRCTTGGIDHGFINWLVYGNKLRQVLRIRIFPQGEGAMNSVGGLKPDTVKANLTGSLQNFWGLLREDEEGRGAHVLNWNGQVAPVVHQIDHFLDELIAMADSTLGAGSGVKGAVNSVLQLFTSPAANASSTAGDEVVFVAAAGGHQDRAWQALAATRCLWGCKSSPVV